MFIPTSTLWTLSKNWFLESRSILYKTQHYTAKDSNGYSVAIIKGYYFFNGRLVDFLYNEAESILVLLMLEHKKTFHLSQWQDLQAQQVLGLVE